MIRIGPIPGYPASAYFLFSLLSAYRVTRQLQSSHSSSRARALSLALSRTQLVVALEDLPSSSSPKQSQKDARAFSLAPSLSHRLGVQRSIFGESGPSLPARGTRSAFKGGEFENNYFTEMCSGSEAGSYLRLVDFVYHSTLGLRVKKKKVSCQSGGVGSFPASKHGQLSNYRGTSLIRNRHPP